MSLYSAYLQETGLLSIVETENGFATYKIQGTECYIQDIYIIPEKRQFSVASGLADRISDLAKQQGCTVLSGSVNTSIKDPTTSIKVLLGYGFKFYRSDSNMLWFVKEL